MAAGPKKKPTSGKTTRWRESKKTKEPVQWKALTVRVPMTRMIEIERARIALELSRDAYVRRKIFEEVPVPHVSNIVEAWSDFQNVVSAFALVKDFARANSAADVGRIEALLHSINDTLQHVLRRLFNVRENK